MKSNIKYSKFLYTTINYKFKNYRFRTSPQIVALEWDGFGGRCNEILNALLVSKVLECNFKFVWPGGDVKILGNVSDQIEYFSQDFITTHCLNSIDGPIYNLWTSPEKSREDLIKEINRSGFINFRIANGSSREIPLIKGINTLELFKELGDTIWSEQAKNVKFSTSLAFKNHQVVNSIHIRSGSLLTGAWRQYPDVQKYVPISVIFAYLKKNTLDKLAIISDTFEISKSVSKNFKNTISNTQLHDETKVKEFWVDLQDLFVMSFSDKVFAPSSSIFSTLGARLGGSETKLIYENFTCDDWDFTLESALNFETYVEYDLNLAKKIQARDIAWLIDRRCMKLNSHDFDKATQIGVAADDSFVVILAQRAISLVSTGNFAQAEKFAQSAKLFAQSTLNTHGDPMYYSMVTMFTVNLIKSLHSLHLTDIDLESLHRQIQYIFAQNVYQIPKHLEVDPNLLELFHELEKLVKFSTKNSKLFKNYIPEEEIELVFSKNFFNNNIYEHFLTHLTSALIATIQELLFNIKAYKRSRHNLKFHKARKFL
jgi:hypothetical protein